METEAYGGPDDLASHARFASTARNSAMSGPAGRAYVYLVYGMYDCLNVVTGPQGASGAVLIRAAAPIAGMDLMRAARMDHARRRRSAGAGGAGGAGAAAARIAALPDRHLARGPGLVGAAFGLDTGWTGTDLCDPASALRIEPGPTDVAAGEVAFGPRVGVGYAGPRWSAVPWRCWIADDPSVSPAR